MDQWKRPRTWKFCCCLIAKSCPALCDPMDCSLPGSSVHGILQARILEWGYHFLLQGNLPNPGIKNVSPAWPALAGRFFTTELPGKPLGYVGVCRYCFLHQEHSFYKLLCGALSYCLMFCLNTICSEKLLYLKYHLHPSLSPGLSWLFFIEFSTKWY